MAAKPLAATTTWQLGRTRRKLGDWNMPSQQFAHARRLPDTSSDITNPCGRHHTHEMCLHQLLEPIIAMLEFQKIEIGNMSFKNYNLLMRLFMRGARIL